MRHSVGPEAPAGLAELRRDPRQAVREEEIVCLVCGRSFRQLTNTHLLSHGLTSADYKQEHGYNPGRAMMCHALRRVYAARAVRIGFAERIRERPIVARPDLRQRGGARRVRLEELLTRREIQRSPRAMGSPRRVRTLRLRSPRRRLSERPAATGRRSRA